MRYLKFSTLLLLSLLGSSISYADNTNSDYGATAVSKSGYTLVFSTETSAASSYFPSSTGVTVASDAFTSSFSDQTTLEKYWTYCPKGNSVWCSRMGTDILEQRQMQSYTDGTLNLKGGQVTSAYDNTSKFLTSGVYTSKNYKYGIIEVKAKCNAHTSNFPAIWIMPADHANDDVYDVPWPACGECDIMEQIGTSTKAYGTVHTGIRYNTFGTSYQASSNESVTDATYHIYTLVWDESSLTWYIDGSKLWTYSKKTDLCEELQYQQFPYNKPYRIILNQAVGKNSSWGAEDPDASYTYEMDVAYVRIFQKTAGYTDPTCSFQTVEVGKTYQITASTGKVLAAASTSSGAKVSGATASSTDALQQWLVKGSAASGYYFHLNNTSYCMQNGTSSVTTSAEEWVTNQMKDGAQEAQTYYYDSSNRLYTFLSDNANTKYYLVLSSDGTLSTTTTESSATTFTFDEPTTKYSVTCNTSTGGTVTATPVSASIGQTVTLTNTPATDYVFSSYSVTDASGNAVTVNSDGTFTMPASNVTVTGTFTATIPVFALKTSGSIDTSKRYLIVYQSSTSAESGILMNSSFTSGSTSYAQCAEAGETVNISNNQITIDGSNAFTFESTGTDGSYYIKNNADYYFGNYSDGSSKTGNWFGVTNTSSPGSNYYNTVGFSNSTVQIKGSYNNMVLGYTTSAGGTSNVSCFHYMSLSSSVYLYEEVKGYSVTCNATTNGTVTASPSSGVSEKATVTLTVTPNTGYELSSLSVKDASNNDVTVTNNTFSMPASNVTVTATFSPITYTITYNLDGGTNASANPSTYTVETETISLADPTKDDYTFSGWTNASGTTVTSVAKGSTGDITLTANWSEITYSITCSDAENGKITANPTTAAKGATVTITATPDDGYVLNTLTVNDGSVETTKNDDGTYTFTMPATAVTVSATFSEIRLDLTDSKPDLVAGTYNAGNVTYTRNGTSGNYGTFCMPFDVKISDATCFDHVYIPHDIALYNTETERLRVFFNEVTDIDDFGDIIPAGQPFIAHLTGAITLSNASSVEYKTGQTPDIINSTINIYNWNEGTGGLTPRNKDLQFVFTGSYDKKTYDDYDSSNLKIKYFITSGAFKELSTDGYIPTFRAYLLLYTLSTAEVKAVDIIFNSDDVTSLNSIIEQKSDRDDVYSIDGRKINTNGLGALKPGLYIKSGKKIIVK